MNFKRNRRTPLSCSRLLEQELYKRIETISRFLEGQLIAIRGSNVFGKICKIVSDVLRYFQGVASICFAQGVKRYPFLITDNCMNESCVLTSLQVKADRIRDSQLLN